MRVRGSVQILQFTQTARDVVRMIRIMNYVDMCLNYLHDKPRLRDHVFRNRDLLQKQSLITRLWKVIECNNSYKQQANFNPIKLRDFLYAFFLFAKC